MLGVVGLTPILAYLGNLGFAPLIALAGILCLPLALRGRRPNLGMAVLVALLAWALISLQWTTHPPDPAEFKKPRALESFTGLKMVFELAFYGAFAMAMAGLSRRAGERATLALGVGMAVLGVVLMIEAGSGAALYLKLRAIQGDPTRPDLAKRDIARAAYIMALLFWPLLVALRLRGWWILASAVSAAGLITAAVAFNVNTPLVALMVGGLGFVLVGYAGRAGVIAWIVSLALYFFSAPWVFHWLGPHNPLRTAEGDIGKLSWAARMDIWSFASQRIFEKPWIGWGLDSSRDFPEIPLHPHDLAIQLWLELGAVGAVLGALFFVWLAGAIDRLEAQDRWAAAAAVGSASAYITIGALSFGAWQEWWLALGALAIATCTALAAARRPHSGFAATS
jgi:O-antigen ligase